MSKIHKHRVMSPPSVTTFADGTPLTIGVDANDALCVWFETGEPTEYMVLFTGSEIPAGFEWKGSCLWNDLVWHLAVKS